MSFPHCQLYFESFRDVITDGPLLDLELKYRVCCRLVGEYNFSPAKVSPITDRFLMFDCILFLRCYCYGLIIAAAVSAPG